MSAKEKQHFYSNKQYKIDFSKYYSDDTQKNIKIDILKSDLDKGFSLFCKRNFERFIQANDIDDFAEQFVTLTKYYQKY